MGKPKTAGAGKSKATAAKSAAKSAATKPSGKSVAPAKSAGKSAAPAKAASKSAAPAKAAAKSRPAARGKSAPVAKGSTSKAASRAPVEVASLLPATGPVTETAMARKKKNVKRGAPPMLPRRMMRRPDPPAGGSAPTPPAAASTRPLAAAPPGSLHAPARVPEGAESLKQRLGTVMTLLNQLRVLRRGIQQRQFFEAGTVLKRLAEPALFQAKGYGSFESFIEREVERELSIGRMLAHDLVTIVRLFVREPAEELGLEKLRNALRAIEGNLPVSAPPAPAAEARHDDT